MRKKQEIEVENTEEKEPEQSIEETSEIYNEINKKSKKERIKEFSSNLFKILSPSKIKAGRFPPFIRAQIFPLPGALSALENSMPSSSKIFA